MGQQRDFALYSAPMPTFGRGLNEGACDGCVDPRTSDDSPFNRRKISGELGDAYVARRLQTGRDFSALRVRIDCKYSPEFELSGGAFARHPACATCYSGCLLCECQQSENAFATLSFNKTRLLPLDTRAKHLPRTPLPKSSRRYSGRISSSGLLIDFPFTSSRGSCANDPYGPSALRMYDR